MEKHKSHLELAREYHILLDELETLSLEYRDVVVEIAKQTCDAHEAPDVEKLRKKLENCEQLSSFLLLFSTNMRKIDHGNVFSQRGGVSQYNREAYEHKERKGHPQIA